METVQPVYFCFGAKSANSKFATKTAEKLWILSFFTVKLPEEAKKIEIFPKFQRWMKKGEHSRSEFYYPEDLETFDVETETGITESQEAIDDFINQQKSANTNKKTATDMDTLLRYMEANGMKNEKIESLPASELDFLLWNFFLNARKKNGEEYEPATVSSL